MKRQAFRAARPSSSPGPLVSDAMRPLNQVRRRAVIIDLNNFSTFPTLAVGILLAALRNSGFDAELLSPLAHDVPAAERERRENIRDYFNRRIHLSTWRPFRLFRNIARGIRRWWNHRPHRRVIREAARILDTGPDVLLLSAYLQHYRSVREIGKLAKARNIPLVLGGPVFNMTGVADAWRDIPGLTAIVGGEADITLPAIVEAACTGGDLLAFDGVTLPDGRKSKPAAPLRDLDRVPVPDFQDFPWDRYRLRVIPLMTGRGCQWNRCTFCSDIVSASGRTYRTRSVESVMHEMREQSQRHQSTNFLFLDLKLNSNPNMFRGIVENVQRYVPGAQWIGTVHIDQRSDNGLSPRELRAAVSSGMRRVSFGLESGSQRILDKMDKGCLVETNSAFIRQAHEAGLSVRCTMFKGFPGETAEDLELSAIFLEEHRNYIDRIRYNDFSVMEDTPIFNQLRAGGDQYPQLDVVQWDHRNARALYRNNEGHSRAYRKAKLRVLQAVYAINRRVIRDAARVFDGLM